MTSTVGPLSPEPREVGENGGGGGPGGVPEGGGGEGGGAAPPTSLNLSKTSLPVLLITANVGSIFDDPKNLVPQWLAQVCRQIKASQAAFVAIHCQEVGGKNFEQSMSNVDEFVSKLKAQVSELGYDRAVAFLDENFAASEKFTALGSIYFLHESLKDSVEIYDFQTRNFAKLRGNKLHLGTIDDVPIVEKHKFPLQYFPESRWSRKGYLRTRWKFSNETTVDFVNIHLFHDASNLKSVEAVPSIYVNYRKRALQYTLDRINNLTSNNANRRDDETHEPKPFFIFGDFNFRLDCKSVVKSLTNDLEICEAGDASSEARQQYVDKRSQELVLTIGKKEFALMRGDHTFRGEWRKWTPYDCETSDLGDRLSEYPLAFPPTYPFEENPNDGLSYMRTRCPAWCDRVLMSHEAKNLVCDNEDNSTCYDIIGKEVCMGDHKPVYLKCSLRVMPSHRSVGKTPRVESPSYTDLLSSPTSPMKMVVAAAMSGSGSTLTKTNANNNGACSRCMDVKEATSVKLFKETTV